MADRKRSAKYKAKVSKTVDGATKSEMKEYFIGLVPSLVKLLVDSVPPLLQSFSKTTQERDQFEATASSPADNQPSNSPSVSKTEMNRLQQQLLLSVKWDNAGEIRRFCIPLSTNGVYKELLKQMQALVPNFNGRLAWKDESGDFISFSSEAEIQEALSCQQNQKLFVIYTVGNEGMERNSAVGNTNLRAEGANKMKPPKILITGLSPLTTDDSLRMFYSRYGRVKKCYVVRNQTTKLSTGTGVVCMSTMEEAEAVLDDPLQKIDGNVVSVAKYEKKSGTSTKQSKNVAATASAKADKSEQSGAQKGLDAQSSVPKKSASSTSLQSGESRSQLSVKDKQDKATEHQRTIYVGGLASETTGNALVAHFKQFGVIKNHFIVYDKKTKRSKGYGFVIFTQPEEALAAINFYPHVLDGKTVEVRAGLSQSERKPANKSKQDQSISSDFPGSIPKTETYTDDEDEGLFFELMKEMEEMSVKDEEDKPAEYQRTIHVGGLAPQTTGNALLAHFRRFGVIVKHFVVYDKITKRSKGFGIVTFSQPKEAIAAINFYPHILDGKTVEVSASRPKKETKPTNNPQQDQSRLSKDDLGGFRPPGRATLPRETPEPSLSEGGIKTAAHRARSRGR